MSNDLNDFYIDKLLEYHGKQKKEVKFVVYNNEKLTLGVFENKIDRLLAKLNHQDAVFMDEDSLYEAIIAGDDWWLEYDCVCCNGPSWYYREHPKKKWL